MEANTATLIPTDPQGLMPADFGAPQPERLRVSLTSVEEFGIPMVRRGFEVPMPRGEHDAKVIADQMAESVRKTALFMMGWGQI